MQSQYDKAVRRRRLAQLSQKGSDHSEMKTERTMGTKPACVADFGTEATVEFYQESERGYSDIESMKGTWHFFVQTLPPKEHEEETG